MPVRTKARHDPAKLYRTVRVLSEALERRRRKVAAGESVEPAPQCDCRECREASSG